MSELFENPDEEILRLRRVGDHTLWLSLHTIIEGMMKWGFNKSQIYEFIRSIPKE